MPIDPQIALSYKAPEIASPAQNIGAIMAIRGQMSDIALRQQQTEAARQAAAENKALAQQHLRDQADQNTIQEISKDSDAFSKIYSGDYSPLRGKVQQSTLENVDKAVQAHLSDIATRTKTQNENRSAALDRIAEGLSGLKTLKGPDGKPDISAINSALPGLVTQLHANDSFKDADITQDIPNGVTDVSQLDQWAAQVGAASAATKKVLERQGEQAKIDQSKATASSEQSTADLNQFKLNMMKGLTDPAAIASSVDALIDPAKFPQANKDAKAAAVVAAKSGDAAKVTDAVKSIYDEQVGRPAGAAATVKAETPAKVAEQAAMLPGEVKKAGAVAMAGVPAHVAGEVQGAKAIAEASPGAFSGILDKGARDQAVNEADKIQQAYTEKVRGSQQLVQTINAAQNGNKAAPGVIPIEQVRSVLANGRVNQSELRLVSSQAGSLLDKIDGWVAGKTEGQPIPAEILKDMSALAVITQQAAKRGYQDGLARLRNRGVDTSKIAEPDVSEQQGHGIPDLGSTFNGGKVLKVEKVQ